jgi:hypothetical protein
MACFWYVIVQQSGTWIPSKDLDWHYTVMFGNSLISETILLLYYSMLTLVANDLIPTTDLEIYMSTLLVFTGTICIGIMIGEIASVLSEMTKRNRIATEDYDNLLSFLTGLKISASVQD